METSPNLLKNWAGNITYNSNRLYNAASVNEVQDIIAKHANIKALGTRHCFNTIADSQHNFISLLQMNKVLHIDETSSTVTMQSGMKYGELAPLINSKGLALHNLASLPHTSVAGACITATHGSGVHNKNLSAAVTAFEFIDAEGRLHHLSKQKDGEKFNGLVVNLGAAGVITSITLQAEPTYNIKQFVFEHLSFNTMKENFKTIMGAGYSVSLFTDWTNDINEVWIKQKANEQQAGMKAFFDAMPATGNLHPIASISAEHCTEQMGVAGAWHERLPHFRMGFTPSSGEELQSEYFVADEHAVDAIMAVQKLTDKISPYLLISEIRSIAADELWLSPCYKQNSTAIHFTWKQNWPAVQKLLPLIEETLAAYNAKPHWGKLFSMTGLQLQNRYEKINAFKSLLKEYDAKGKFRNDFLNRNIFVV
ncbi:D-arabinono-1,4-lactone oxidase [Parafilimonas terrae]|uniref:Xylitol oxidase n=1 Tax=Parafilimonas terrae TaxID=1465490 RepID=A0A1I5UYQ6_9BACT|nr:D-arabinono-1,4-lactone oxidase [Parafilimonas terrae]SFP99826.1 xylitol oxidase [Parafilimonas terrae]